MMARLVFLLLALCSFGAWPQALPVPRVAFPPTQVGNVITYGAATANAANAANFSFGAAANGDIFAQATDNVPTAGGKSVVITAKGGISRANAAKAFIAASKLFAPVGMAIAAKELYDIYKEITGDQNPSVSVDSQGLKVEYIEKGGQCPAYNPSNYPCSGWQGGCVMHIVNGYCILGSSASPYWNLGKLIESGTPRILREPDINSRVNDPLFNSPNYWKAIKKAAESNVPVDIDSPVITGPVESPEGTPTQTVSEKTISDSVNNGERVKVVERTITQTVPNSKLDYDKNTVTRTDAEKKTATTETITTRTPVDQNGNPTGPSVVTKTTTSSGTETTTKPGPDPQPEIHVSDVPLPELPTLYEKKYPDGLPGVWNSKMAEIRATPLLNLVNGLAPNLGDGGCPSWQFHMQIGPWNWGTMDASPPCSVWTFVRVCMIVSALFLARALIFGG